MLPKVDYYVAILKCIIWKKISRTENGPSTAKGHCPSVEYSLVNYILLLWFCNDVVRSFHFFIYTLSYL